MIETILRISFVLSFVLLSKPGLEAQVKSSPILFIYDASGSMWGEMNGKTKKEVAADVLSTAVTNLPDSQEVGLMAYGHRRKSDCDDVELICEVLEVAASETIDDPAGNFSVYAIKNGEPVDALVKAFKSGTNESIDEGRTYRDSAFVYLPPGNYDIVIRHLENSDIAEISINVEMKEGETGHQTVSFDGATLLVYTTNNNEGWDVLVKMISKSTGKVISSARTYGSTKSMEVDPGAYDVTFEALAIEGLKTTFKMEGIEIKGGETKSVSHNFETGIAMIGVKIASGELVDATVNFNETNSGKAVAAGRTYTTESSNPKKFVLNPGAYLVKIVTLGKHKGTSDSFQVTVSTGESVERIVTY